MSVCFGARAQASYSVSGTLLDAGTRQPLPFANVVLLRAQDSTLVTGAQTGEDGAFTLTTATPGAYSLRASVLGYRPFRRAVVLTAAAPRLALGSLILTSTTTQLGEVTVTGEKAAVVDNLDKKVINVSKDLNSVGGTAVDVLQNVPSVAVDQSGQVSLRGTPNVTIYVDGKPVPSTFRLDQLPASRIENVEVITNPSARYSAAGAGGVINITLKKNRQDGWNGQASGNVGTQDKYNGTLSLNRKTGKVNLFGSYDVYNGRWRGRTRLNQVAAVAGDTTRTAQDGRSTEQNQSHSARLGFDYNISDQQTLTVAGNVDVNRGSETEYLNTLLTRGGAAPLALRNLGYSDYRQHEIVLNSDYRRTWAAHQGRELTGSFGYVWLGATAPIGQRVLDGPADYPRQERRQELGVTINMYEAQTDYVHPVGEKNRLDVGLKSEGIGTEGSANYLLRAGENGAFVRQDAFSYDYQYRQRVHAGYATWQQTLGPWSYQAGLRAEYTSLTGHVVPETGRVRQHYLNLFPSAHVVRTLPGDQRLQLSYSRRLNRPGFMQALPLPIYQDQRNYRIGNPNLRPEYVNALELGHQVTLGQTSLTSTLFWRQTNQALQSIRGIDTAATRRSGQPYFITRTGYQNFGHTNTFGLELAVNQPLTKWWKLAANGSFYRNEVTSFSGDGQNRRGLTGTARLLSTFTPAKALDVQLTGTYRAPILTPQGRLSANYGLDLALRQRLFNDRAALTLRLSDLFNTRRQYSQLYADDLSTDFQRKNETRVGYLGFTWFFGTDKPGKKIDQGPQGGGGGFGG